MSILAHNLYRLLALSLDRYEHMSDERIYKKFIVNNGEIAIEHNEIRIDLKKKRELPQLIELSKSSNDFTYTWLDNRKIIFIPTASS
jgi:hypothetical protein